MFFRCKPYLFLLLVNFTSTTFAQNCPGYSSTVSSPSESCGNQQYILQVANTNCNGTVTFSIQGNYGSSFANELTWSVVSQQSGVTVASGGPGTNGTNFNVVVGPLDFAVHGNVFNVILNDAFGDGFNGTGGFFRVVQGGTVIAGPVTGNFGSQWRILIGAGVDISPVTVNVNTPSGMVSQVVSNCAEVNIPFNINSNNFCSSTQVSLPWSIICNVTGQTLASGTHDVLLYPRIPSSASDLVSVSYNSSNCSWDVTPLNDCVASDLGSVFSIFPSPNTLVPGCIGQNQSFQVSYNGLNSGPDCCVTGGPLVPYSYSQNTTTANTLYFSIF
jgi:hypothetical protein